MINAIKLNASAHAWGEPISEVLRTFIHHRKIKREQIISVSFPNALTCILVFEEEENDAPKEDGA